jgi:hypothetical protein
MERVVVFGSRQISDEQFILGILAKHLPPNCEVKTGGARGVDQVAEKLLKTMTGERKLTETWKPEWGLGKFAALKRNEQMAEWATMGIGIWDCESRGTEHMMEQLDRLKKPYILVKCMILDMYVGDKKWINSYDVVRCNFDG